MRLRFAILTVTLCAAAAVARAQGNPVAITEADLTASGSWGDKAGQTVELSNVKYRDYYNPNVRLVRIQQDKLRLDDQAHPQLANNLARKPPVVANGTLDTKGRSNVRVIGIARDGDNGRYIDVIDVTKLPDDIDLFKQRLEKVDANDADGRMKLADEAKRRAETFGEDDLRDWARQCYDGALDVKKAALAKGDVKAAIDLALKYRDLAGLPTKAIALLGDIVLDASIDASERDKAAAVLEKQLDAVLHRDKWISREEFKAALGYVARRDGAGNVQWVRRERIEFDAEVAQQRKLNAQDPNLRKLLGSEYETAANEGRPTIGMYKQELVRTKGYGFPQLVDRFTEKSSGSDLVWDQWVMPDGSRFYFMNGILFDWKKKDVSFPK